MKLYRTVFTFEVLSDEPLESLSLERLNHETTDGHCSGMFLDTNEEEVSSERMNELLITHGIDPSFLLDTE